MFLIIESQYSLSYQQIKEKLPGNSNSGREGRIWQPFLLKAPKALGQGNQLSY